MIYGTQNSQFFNFLTFFLKYAVTPKFFYKKLYDPRKSQFFGFLNIFWNFLIFLKKLPSQTWIFVFNKQYWEGRML